MGPISSVVAWIGFGVVAGIVAMILPHSRGFRGIAINMAAGVGGALFFGFLGRLLGLYATRASFSFLFAAVGALVTLFAYHVVWTRRHARAATPMRRDHDRWAR